MVPGLPPGPLLPAENIIIGYAADVSFTKRLSLRFASPKVGRIKTVNKASEWSFHIVYSSQALA